MILRAYCETRGNVRTQPHHWVCGCVHLSSLLLVLCFSCPASGFFIQLVLLVSSSINWFEGKPSQSGQIIINKGSLPARKACAMRVCYVTAVVCDPMDCSPPGSSVHGILQARILAWAAVPFSRGSSRPGDWTPVSCASCIGKQVLYAHKAPRKL